MLRSLEREVAKKKSGEEACGGQKEEGIARLTVDNKILDI